MFVDVMFVCCCISSSNIFISSISDKPQMQTDYKNKKFPLMITNIFNIDGMIVVVRRTSNDVYERYVRMLIRFAHKLWWYATIKIDQNLWCYDTTINHQFCRVPTVSFVVLLSKCYHCRRIKCTTIQLPTNNVYKRGFGSMRKLTRWYATIKIDAQALIRYNNQPSILPCRTASCFCPSVAIIIKLNIQQINCHCWGVVSRLLFWFGRTWIR